MSAGTKQSPNLNLSHRTAVAFGWGVSALALKLLLTVFVQAAMARLLGPSAFGIFAMGVLVMGFAGYFADVGVSTRLVQQETITDADIGFALAINLLTSCAVSLAVVLGAEQLAAVFGTEEAAPIFISMAPVFLFNALASVSVSLLRRRLDYRTIQLAGLGGYVVGFAIVGLLCAAFLDSVYALVAAYMTQSIVSFALLYTKVRHPFRLTVSSPDRWRHLSFGGTVLVTNLVNWLSSSIDRVIIGRLYNAEQLGYYSAANNLVLAPIGALYQNLQSTVFSSLARMSDDRDRMRDAYLALLTSITVVVFPAFAGAFLLADELILVVYGSHWAQAAGFAQIFCLVAPFQLVWGISTPVLWNTNRKSLEALVQAPFVVVVVAAMLLAAQQSLIAVAWVAAMAYILRTMTIVALACHALRINFFCILRRISPAALPAFLVTAAVWGGDHLLTRVDANSIVKLAVGGVSDCAMLIMTILVFPRLLPAAFRNTVYQAVRRISREPRKQ